MRPRPRAPWPSAVLLAATACLPDNPIVDEGETGGTETGGERVEAGLLGCASGEACTIVAVSQTIDDRVELFTGAGPGPSYRGALDLDLKPNPGGDISGQNLDEPYGLAWDGAALHVLVGHYPNREVGSLLSFPAAGLTAYDEGARVAVDDWFAGGQVTGLDALLTPLERTEPLSMVVHGPSGALLIATFANDLMVADAQWTAASELLALTPGDGEALVADPGCAGAWSIAALDADGDSVALACDGDETVAILDTSPLAEGSPPSPTCVAEIPFSDKRVRYLAADGLGGVVVAEHPAIISASEDARLWWFDGGCGLRGFSTFADTTSWLMRELELVPGPAPRWLLARADGDARGVVILSGDVGDGSIVECGRLSGLDDAGAWTAAGGTEPLRPHALALTSDGTGLAIGAGPADYDNAGPGWGSVWWTTLDYGDEACDAIASDPIELSAAAPAVDAQLPQTWRRAPDVITLIEVPE